MIRRLIQFVSAFAGNSYLLGFVRGTIYQGPLKSVCFPGMNCYSCPGAVFACPIGSLQAVLTQPGALHSIAVGKPEGIIFFYVLGFIFLIGSLVGRLLCGWVCPFGFIQDLLHKIPTRKVGIPRQWRLMKYAILVVFVLLLPLFLRDGFGVPWKPSADTAAVEHESPSDVKATGKTLFSEDPGSPWFCKVICPVGTLEGGVTLVSYDRISGRNRFSLGFLFYFKLSVLGVFLVWIVMAKRPFCRTVCPLGAIWGIFNKVSVWRMHVDTSACTKCLACRKVCPVGCSIFEEPDSAECVRCLDCVPKCPKRCISSGTGRSAAVARPVSKVVSESPP
ncbi:MAG: 4Fe-4S binding protein [Planctomycetota bacterium]|nr:4Fe-4S binding protein [Planctomycetota bacterium]